MKDGKDGDFGRTLFLEELEGPYYALKQLPQRYRSNGGVKTNQSGQVLSVVGAVIPTSTVAVRQLRQASEASRRTARSACWRAKRSPPHSTTKMLRSKLLTKETLTLSLCLVLTNVPGCRFALPTGCQGAKRRIPRLYRLMTECPHTY